MPDEEVIVLALCEQNVVYLRPDILYRFEVIEGCTRCEKIAKEGSVLNNGGIHHG